MKKKITSILTLICVLGLVLALVGCNEHQPNGRDTSPNPAYIYIVMEATENNLLVAETDENGKAIDAKQYSVPNWFYPSTEIKAGYKITIKHNDKILETYPMKFAEISSMEYYDRETGLSTVVIPD